MNATTMAPNGRRALVLGRAAPVLETVLGDLAELGIAAEGTTEPKTADRRFDARDFELVAFGGGVPEATVERLTRAFTARHPGIRLLRSYAPRAVHEIAAALTEREPADDIDLDAYCARIGYDDHASRDSIRCSRCSGCIRMPLHSRPLT